MTVNSSRNALKRRTWALFMFFFLPGLLMASWATRTPAIRDILSVSIAEMGGVLFGLSIGSMSGILCSAWLVKRFGTRNVILVTMSCALIGMMILSLALWLTSPLLFAVGLGVFGAWTRCARIWTRTRPRCVPGFPLWGTPMTLSAINLCDNRRMLP